MPSTPWGKIVHFKINFIIDNSSIFMKLTLKCTTPIIDQLDKMASKLGLWGNVLLSKIKYWIGSVVLSCSRPVVTRLWLQSINVEYTFSSFPMAKLCILYISDKYWMQMYQTTYRCRTETYSYIPRDSKWRNKTLIATRMVNHKAQRPSPIFYIQMFIGDSIIEGKNFSRTCQRIGAFMIEATKAFFFKFYGTYLPISL